MSSKLPSGLTIKKVMVSYVVTDSNGTTVAIAAPWEDSRGVFCIMDSFVAPHMRRRGIATMLYSHIEEVTGRQLSPAISLSDDAFEFWKRYRPQAVAYDFRHRLGELLGHKVLMQQAGESARMGTIVRASGRSADALFDDALERVSSVRTLVRDEVDEALSKAREFARQHAGWRAPDGVNEEAAWQVAHQLRIPPRAVADTVLMTARELANVVADEGTPNSLQVEPHDRLPLGSAGVRTAYGDDDERYLCFLAKVPSQEVMPTEGENGIRRHKTFDAYVQMLRDGHEPPYVSLYERALDKLEAGQPRWTTSNRRRCLTAQEVGAPLTGWLSVDNHATGLPLKVGDVKRAYAAALQRQTQAQAQTNAAAQDAAKVMEVTNPIAQALRQYGQDSPEADPVTQCIEVYRHEYEGWVKGEAESLREINDRCEVAGALEAQELGRLIIESVEEMKSELGARAANAVGDDEQAQDDAISRAERWVSENLADSAGPEVILWARGLTKGEEAINQALAPRQVPRGG